MARKKHDDGSAPAPDTGAGVGAGDDERVVSPVLGDARERDEDAALRPRSFGEFIGQRKVADNLAVYVAAARQRKEALDHVLLSGPPGLGKTTLAFVLAREMGTNVHLTSGPALERKGDLAGILTSLARGDVLFIDEIHRLLPVVEESLYPAMEDFRIEILTGSGAGAAVVPMSLERFTLVGATTRPGMLSGPLLSRFGITEAFEFYSPEDLTTIVKRSARLLKIEIDDSGAAEIGRRARGTPRIANRILRRVRDFAQVHGSGVIDRAAADFGLDKLGIDRAGLDRADRQILRTMHERFDGGPVGVESLAASLAEDRDTLEYVYEPYLIQEGYLIRTPRGRQLTRRAYEHLGLPTPARGPGQGSLF